uniref:K Homology domain-containing protein n=1 Tax=Picea sitchensis TaxID=3332 RepID=D5A8F6_PICSI|nr:unknown [Picea sitchensis]
MQIPLSYADDVIGVEGTNIGYMRRASGATITIQETRGVPSEITVEIKGTNTQVQTAQHLIQNFMAGGHKKITHNVDAGYGSYAQNSNSFYPSSTVSSHPVGGYGSSYGTGYGY